MGAGSVLLISPNTVTCPTPVYPLALARLAGALAEDGHRVRQHDVLVAGPAALPRAIAESKPDLVGISLRNVDSITSEETAFYLEGYCRVVQAVRDLTKAPIVVGGSAFSIFPRELMRLTGADFGVTGPGEEALCALVRALEEDADPAAIPGVMTRDSAGAPAQPCAAVFARPIHDPDILRYHWENAGMIGLQTKRGCPQKCFYCTYPRIDGRQVAWADPIALVDEVERMFKDFGVAYFFAVDSVFNLEPARETAFAEELRKRALPVSWGAFFRPAGMDGDYLALLKASGLKHCEFGTDSLCDSVLFTYEKGFTVEEVVRASALTRELGLLRAHYLVLGGPGETPDTLRETMRNAERLPGSVFFPFPGVRIYPNTALHARAVAEGAIAPEADCLEPVFYFAPGLTASAIWEVVGPGTGLGSAWVQPSQYPALYAAIVRMRRRGYRGPLWEHARFIAHAAG